MHVLFPWIAFIFLRHTFFTNPLNHYTFNSFYLNIKYVKCEKNCIVNTLKLEKM